MEDIPNDENQSEPQPNILSHSDPVSQGTQPVQAAHGKATEDQLEGSSSQTIKRFRDQSVRSIRQSAFRMLLPLSSC